MKPGLKTTEFWIGLVMPHILALLIAFGVIDAGQSEALQGAAEAAGASGNALVAAIISGLSALGYNIGRGNAKGGNGGG
jgi:hypothetical protein